MSANRCGEDAYDGWLETLLYARFPKHELVIRNIGFSGDEIDLRLRSKNFGTPDEWLSGIAEPIGGYEENRLEGTNTKADVIFAFFGYNESYAGKEGLETFKQKLSEFVAHTIAQKYNGKTAPRVVLFSPVAHENLGNPDLPDGADNNRRLALYTQAMGEVAAARGITFVDLFAPSTKLYESIAAPLTIQGIHLNAEGNRQISQVIDRTLFGAPVAVPPAQLERLRQAVVDKDLHWFNRYRVTDGFATYGDRAFLTFIRGNPRNVNAEQPRKPARTPSAHQLRGAAARAVDAGLDDGNRDRRIWRWRAGPTRRSAIRTRPGDRCADQRAGPGPDNSTSFSTASRRSRR